VGIALFGDPETKPSNQQGPAHVWKGKKQKAPSTESVNGLDSGKREQEVDKAEAPRGKKGTDIASTGLRKDGRRVKGNNINWQKFIR
jgi:hypothetical protein